LNRPPDPPEDDVLYIDDEGADEVARVMADAERAVSAMEQRRRTAEGGPESGEHQRSVPSADPKLEPGRAAELEKALALANEKAASADEEAARLRETLLRKTADFDNLKRRTEREKTDFFKFALAETFRDLLAVLDNFERALAHAPGAGQGGDFRVGIEMIARQLAETLKRYGLSEVGAKGLPFDPNIHEAVMREETDSAPPGTVLDVLQKGYVLNDRLLRPALVKVSGAPAPSAGGDQ
jgi:molecular chaperone GrpE